MAILRMLLRMVVNFDIWPYLATKLHNFLVWNGNMLSQIYLVNSPFSQLQQVPLPFKSALGVLQSKNCLSREGHLMVAMFLGMCRQKEDNNVIFMESRECLGMV